MEQQMVDDSTKFQFIYDPYIQLQVDTIGYGSSQHNNSLLEKQIKL
jgi:hypothetical protein